MEEKIGQFVEHYALLLFYKSAREGFRDFGEEHDGQFFHSTS